jgi:hypothetical protein
MMGNGDVGMKSRLERKPKTGVRKEEKRMEELRKKERKLDTATISN